jgi:MFS family permease
MPVIVLYFQDNGLSIQDIFILQIIFSVMIVALEVPSGYFADTFGRRGSLIIGTNIAALGYLLYFLAGGFWGFALAEIALAVSLSFISGADSAFLYDTLKQYKSTDKHVKYEGLITSMSRFAEGIAALMATVLVIYVSLKNLLLIQFLVSLLAIPLAWSLKEPIIAASIKVKLSIFGIVRFVMRENKKLLYLNIYSGLISASTLMMVWFAQPYWSELGVDIFYFGLMWAGLNFLVAIAAFFAHRLNGWLSIRQSLLLFAMTPFVLYLVLALDIGWWALLIIPLFWVLRGLAQPVLLDYINKEVDSSMRATVLSISSLFGRLFFSIFSPFLGWVADVWSLQTAFFASGVSLGLCTVIVALLLVREIIRRNNLAT